MTHINAKADQYKRERKKRKKGKKDTVQHNTKLQPGRSQQPGLFFESNGLVGSTRPDTYLSNADICATKDESDPS